MAQINANSFTIEDIRCPGGPPEMDLPHVLAEHSQLLLVH